MNVQLYKLQKKTYRDYKAYAMGALAVISIIALLGMFFYGIKLAYERTDLEYNAYDSH